MSTARGRHRLPLMLTVLFAVVLIVIPVGSTGAYWTTSVTGASANGGAGAWCATPATSGANSRFIRLSDITTDVGSNRKMAIIPVANNAAWGGNGTTNHTLSVRLYNCHDTPDPLHGLRVLSWANPALPATYTRAWLPASGTDSAVAPSSRLNPVGTTGLGPYLRDLSQAADVRQDALLGLGSSGLRRYSWIVANSRTRAAPALNPAPCAVTLASSNCSVPIPATGGGENLVKDLVDVTPWDTPGESVTYAAQTFAAQAPTGWSGAPLNCVTVGLTCTSVATATRLNATVATAATLYGSTDGNQLQWLVIQYTGVTVPTDLVLEVVLG